MSSTTGGKETKIVIALPTLTGYHCLTYHALLDMMLHGRDIFAGWTSTNTTYLPEARNICVRQIYDHNPDFTHILFVDDDMVGFTRDHVDKLLAADKEIIGGFYTRRMPPHTATCLLKEESDDGICECWHVGTGFMLVKKQVFDRLRIEPGYWFFHERMLNQTIFDEFNELKAKYDQEDELDLEEVSKAFFELGANGTDGNTILGEDVHFCRRAIGQGIPVYVDLSVKLGHVGEKVYTVADLEMATEEENVQDAAACLKVD